MKTITVNDHKRAPTHKPYVLSNWCSIDSLDGQGLVDGEKLMVTWPDGSITEEKVTVINRTEAVNDMGHMCQIPISEAYIKSQVRGATMTVRVLLVKQAERKT